MTSARLESSSGMLSEVCVEKEILYSIVTHLVSLCAVSCGSHHALRVSTSLYLAIILFSVLLLFKTGPMLTKGSSGSAG